jgi:hypothetical protein
VTRGEASRFSRPQDGSVRVLFTRVGPEHLKWSLIGERNWVKPDAQGASFRLKEVYPLNATHRRGGCHTWELDLVGEPKTWRLRLHGSNGATAETRLPREGELEVRIDRDTELRLPAETTLATLGRVPVRLSIAR